MNRARLKIILLTVLALPFIACGQPPVDPDPNGVLLKPIPDKLVVLTFDDAPASHATVVAPILKEMGFGGSIYVCDFDSFKTRKDWYLTYRQMNSMHAAGLEIGNHSLGHQSGYEPMLAMEDQVLAHGGPRMTTLCWPIYNVNWNDCPKLSAHGYTFGRGGHERPYRPTMDNPFDIPSFSMSDGISMENFTKKVQQACQGRVVVLTFHGVPDLEHPPVSLEPDHAYRLKFTYDGANSRLQAVLGAPDGGSTPLAQGTCIVPPRIGPFAWDELGIAFSEAAPLKAERGNANRYRLGKVIFSR